MNKITGIQIVVEEDSDIFADTVNMYLQEGYSMSSIDDIEVREVKVGWWLWSETYFMYSVRLVKHEKETSNET